MAALKSLARASALVRPFTFEHWTRYTPLVEIISDSTDARMKEIYEFRYKVLNQQTKHTKFVYGTHPQVYKSEEDTSGLTRFQVRDGLDEDESTVQYAVRSPTTGKYVSAIRTVDGNKSKLEMEQHKWFEMPGTFRGGGGLPSTISPSLLCSMRAAAGARYTSKPLRNASYGGSRPPPPKRPDHDKVFLNPGR